MLFQQLKESLSSFLLREKKDATLKLELSNLTFPCCLVKKTGAILDTQNDKKEMFKQPVLLGLTSSGHNYVDIRDKDNTENQNKDVILTTVAEEEVLLLIGNVSPAKASQTLRSGISRQVAEAHSKLMEQKKKKSDSLFSNR